MDECKNYIELISTMLDGELSQSETAELMAHIRTCSSCNAAFSAFSTLSAELEHMTPVPDGLSASVMEQIQKHKNIFHIRWKGYIAVAACLVLVFTAGIRYGLFENGLFGSTSTAGVLMCDMNAATSSIDSCEIQAETALGAPEADLATPLPKAMTVAVPESSNKRGLEAGIPDSEALVYVNSIVMSEANSETLSLTNCSSGTVSITLSDEDAVEKLLSYLEYGEAAEAIDSPPLVCIEMADSSRITIWDDGQVITCELNNVVFHPAGTADDIRSFIDDIC